jgi:hypothetical protein
MSKLQIEPGQRFRSTDFDLLWVVAEIFEDHCGRPHARLALAEDSWTRKTLACDHLADAQYFAPLDEAPRPTRSPLALFRRKRVA